MAAATNAAMMSGLYPLGPHALRARARRLSTPTGAGGARTRLAAEWAIGWAASLARPIGYLGLPLVPSRRGPRPIVLVHGYAMSRAYFLLLALRLARAGLGPIHGFEYWTLGRVASAARRLGEYVERICELSGSAQVDLIGHSMGGVVARYYVALSGGAARVRHLVTIGSPHRGTSMSRFGLGRPVHELLPGSPLLQRLEAAGLHGVTSLAIWSRGDALVWCEEQACLKGAHEVAFDDLGHLSLLASRRVAREVAAFLGRGSEGARPAGDGRAS